MVRPSFNQPESRHASGTKNRRRTSKAYASASASASRRPPSKDYGLDTFSYSEDFVAEWQMPAGLADKLPKELSVAADDWAYAGAAVCTALERIEKLNSEACDRVHPDIVFENMYQRRKSSGTASLARVDSLRATSILAHDCTSSTSATKPKSGPFIPCTQFPANMIGMESPPFTPVDTQPPGTPTMPSAAHSSTEPDLQHLAAQLSPLSSQGALTRSSTGSSSADSEQQAWEVYAKSFNSEIHDVRANAVPRFRGFDHIIQRILLELERDRSVRADTKAAVQEFAKWWEEMKPKVRYCHDKVDLLQKKPVGDTFY